MKSFFSALKLLSRKLLNTAVFLLYVNLVQFFFMEWIKINKSLVLEDYSSPKVVYIVIDQR